MSTLKEYKVSQRVKEELKRGRLDKLRGLSRITKKLNMVKEHKLLQVKIMEVIVANEQN